MTDTALHAVPAQTLVIIGGGYSGTLTAVHLLREGRGRPLELVLIEQRARPGRGLAYHIWDDSMLLNVPAGNMSAFAEQPAHFLDYCRGIDPAFNAGSFVPRRIFGDYLEHTLREAEKDSDLPLTRLKAEAVALRRDAATKRLRVELADGRSLDADRVVLALGYLGAQQPHFGDELFSSAAWIVNPWNFAAMDRIEDGRPVLIVGTGHTAVDALFRLTGRDDSRKVYMVSRRGLLPKGHRANPQPPVTGGFPAYLEGIRPTTLAHLRAIRQELARRVGAGHDWRDVINELRPHTPEIWRRLPVAERRRFLTHLVPYWDIHRHRLAPAAHRRLRGMLERGQVEVVAGRICGCELHGDAVRVNLRERASGRPLRLEVAAVVNCTGPRYDITHAAPALVAQLHEQGWLQPDALKLGLEFDDDDRPIGRDGRPVDGLYYVGPMLKARYWEAIAVPELRRHTLALAHRLLADVAA
jgi:uncharacterized NAD(P)/FAD-binding protein YdhS